MTYRTAADSSRTENDYIRVKAPRRPPTPRMPIRRTGPDRLAPRAGYQVNEDGLQQPAEPALLNTGSGTATT